MSLYIEKSQINGNGLHTDCKIIKGERIGVIHGPVEIVHKFTGKLIKNSLNWIGIGRYSWINTNESPFRFINHSCEPNAYIIGKRIVVALKNIEAGSEITMDYSLTEADPDYLVPGGCRCKSKNCRHEIGPIFSLTQEQFQKAKPLITPPFQKIYNVEAKRNHTSHK